MPSTATSRSDRFFVRTARVSPRRVSSRTNIDFAKRRVEMNASSEKQSTDSGGVHLLIVGSPHNELLRIESTAKLSAKENRHLLVLFRDGAENENKQIDCDALLKNLEVLCDAIARVAPTLDFTPLLPVCGWNFKHARARADALAHPKGDVVVSGHLVYSLDPPSQPCSPEFPQFQKVSVGGTFDRLHAGHRLLLTAAVAVTASDGTLYIGVTGEELLKTKTHKHKIEPYEVRAANAESFVRKIKAPGYIFSEETIIVGPLDGAPPLAATVADMSALVVSRETIEGADAVNAMRLDNGFEKLTLVAVGVIGGSGDTIEEKEKNKLSSSALRAEEVEGGKQPE